jgi:anti-sigma factor RsiW
MPASETDLELLETYLDGELSPGEVAMLRPRLSAEPELAAAMDQLREQRQLRQHVFCLCEAEAEVSDDVAVGNVSRAVRAAITRDIVWSGRMRTLRQVSAAAACLIVGLLVGWFARGSTPVEPTVRPSGIVRGPTIPSNSNAALVNRAGGFNVQLTDDTGRVLAVQHFDSLDKAREFSDDLFKWQARQRKVRNGEVRLVGDDF